MEPVAQVETVYICQPRTVMCDATSVKLLMKVHSGDPGTCSLYLIQETNEATDLRVSVPDIWL